MYHDGLTKGRWPKQIRPSIILSLLNSVSGLACRETSDAVVATVDVGAKVGIEDLVKAPETLRRANAVF
jgi:hypothetical protein